MKSWVGRSFKFQWQKIKNEYLGPGLVLTSPHWESKFVIQRNKKIITFVTLDCVVIKQG